jgi:uncharacterized protein (DUF2235 family)
VLDIYRYACRNYQPHDEIYGFGFSRGAFTMRVVIALIASEGLVDSSNEDELRRRSVRAYRRLRLEFLPRKLTWPTRLFRAIRDRLIGWSDRWRGIEPYDDAASNRHPPIRFVGVWDTVSAYGGPNRGDHARDRHTGYSPSACRTYELNRKVLCARHALAIDDERDSFHPLLWDEVCEEEMRERSEVPEGRLQQVWFTGMHSDVGGGYPDESLSYVSLLWMMEEAEKAGLRTLHTIKDRSSSRWRTAPGRFTTAATASARITGTSLARSPHGSIRWTSGRTRCAIRSFGIRLAERRGCCGTCTSTKA